MRESKPQGSTRILFTQSSITVATPTPIVTTVRLTKIHQGPAKAPNGHLNAKILALFGHGEEIGGTVTQPCETKS
jgi:hypothetical protein